VNQSLFSILKIQMKLTSRFYVLRFTLSTLLLASCSALERPTLGTATPLPPTPTPLLSPTPIWFPPTETPTPSALTVPTATPDYMPGLGRTLYTDDFTDPADWSDLGTDYIRDGRLTLAASNGTYLTTLHDDLILGDFYAEVTAQLSLCRGADEYGLLVRAIPASYYRFTVNCNGELKADRITNSQRVPLKMPFPTLDAPRVEVRTGSDLAVALVGELEPAFGLSLVGCRVPPAGHERTGAVALLGPDRMDYEAAIPLVEYAARALASRPA